MPAKSAEAIAGANARKRIKRAIKRIEKQRALVKNRSQAKAFTQQINELRKQQKATYAPRGGFKTEKQKQRLQDAISKVEKINARSKTLKSATQVRNFAFREQMRWASSANLAPMSTLEPEKVKAFFRVTEKIWESVPYSQREKAILKYFDTNSLQEAFEKALSDPKVKRIVERQIELARIDAIPTEYRSEEEEAFYTSESVSDSTDKQGSPDWVMELPQINPVEDWKEYISGEVAK